jgi:hypothetical protein
LGSEFGLGSENQAVKSKKPIIPANGIQSTSVAASAGAVRDFTPSSRFWTHFVKHHWNRQPLVIKNPFSLPVSPTEEMFAALAISVSNQTVVED